MITQTFTGYTRQQVDTLVQEFLQREQKIQVIKTYKDIQYAKDDREKKMYITTIRYVRINV